jgi:hypothetical protein
MTDVKTKVSDIKFDAMRNAMYHSWRKGFLDRLNRVLSFVVIVAGATAFSDLASQFGFARGSQLLAGIAALAGALQLVFDFGVQAREHDFLQRRFYELVAEITECASSDDASLAKWEGHLFRLYAEEPAMMRALDAMAYNAASESIGASDKRVVVTWYQTILSQVWPFNHADFPYASSTSKSATPAAS